MEKSKYELDRPNAFIRIKKEAPDTENGRTKNRGRKLKIIERLFPADRNLIELEGSLSAKNEEEETKIGPDGLHKSEPKSIPTSPPTASQKRSKAIEYYSEENPKVGWISPQNAQVQNEAEYYKAETREPGSAPYPKFEET